MEFLFPARWCVGSNQIPSRLAFSSSVLETLNSLIAFSLRTENFPREALGPRRAPSQRRDTATVYWA